MRTRSEMHIFNSEVIDPDNTINILRKEKTNIMHYEILTRILFVYAKLNPGIGYVQGFIHYKGMNEILAPFYYVFL